MDHELNWAGWVQVQLIRIYDDDDERGREQNMCWRVGAIKGGA